ncbi:MAG: Trm112 family protein [Planctomycetota bacterium]
MGTEVVMLTLDPELLAILACPVPTCHGALEPREDRLVCVRCGRRYRIEDRWPVLIPEEAEQPEEA